MGAVAGCEASEEVGFVVEGGWGVGHRRLRRVVLERGQAVHVGLVVVVVGVEGTRGRE